MDGAAHPAMTLSPDIMLAPRVAHDLQVEVIHATGIDGARNARGLVVVIDVLRAFTVSAYALAGGARECRLVTQTAEAIALAKIIPGALICAEEDGLPIPGIPISNSPTQIKQTDMNNRILVQRSSAGTQVAAAVPRESDMFAASLVVATATVQACLLRRPRPTHLTLVASADHPEDHACAFYMEKIIRGESPDAEQLLEPLKMSDRYRRLISGAWPGFPPTDLDLALALDRFNFAMPVTRTPIAGHLTLTLTRTDPSTTNS
jgi:2-phosphosulfolactate phosphatase